jgi:hypothetical protein
MIKAYIDYNDPCVTIHRNPLCVNAKVGPDQKIRHLLLNPGSLSKELSRFRNNKHRFTEEPGMNDMWLVFDFQDSEFEMALVSHLKKLAGRSNSTIKDCKVQVHC